MEHRAEARPSCGLYGEVPRRIRPQDFLMGSHRVCGKTFRRNS
jgi:hypothetical protein